MLHRAQRGVGQRRPRVVRTLLVVALGAAALVAPVVGAAPQQAQAAGGAVYIDDPLQSGSLSGWTLQGAGNVSNPNGSRGDAWNPKLSTVAANNAMPHSYNTNNCGVDTTSDSWPLCTATFDAARDSSWMTLTSDNTNDGAGQAATALHNTTFSSGLGVVLEYDQRVYRTNDGRTGGFPASQGGGDGIDVYLVDANPDDYGNPAIDTTPGESGGYGAGLGYASVSATGDGWCAAQQGVAGGYIGVGFDVYGNYQKAERSTGFGKYHRATRPYTVSLANPDAFDGVDASVQSARIPQSIGLRGAGVRYTSTPGCSAAGDLSASYGMTATSDPLVTSAGVRTVFQVKWAAGDAAAAYAGEYRAEGSSTWTAVPAAEVPARLTPAGFTDARGYVRFEVPVSAGDFDFRYTKSGTTTAAFADISRDVSLGNAPAYTALNRTVGGYRWLAGTENLSAHPNPTTSGLVDSNAAARSGAVIDNAATDADDYRRIRITLDPKADGSRTVTVFWTDKLDVSDDRCYDDGGVEIPGVRTTASTDECLDAGGTWSHGGDYAFHEQFSYDLAASPFQADLPETFRLGFAASTGWAVNFHQIRNLRVTSLVDLAVDKQVQPLGADEEIDDQGWSDHAVVRAGGNAAYRLIATNNGPSDIDAAYPATLTDGLEQVPFADAADVSWTATATGDARVCAAWDDASATCDTWGTSRTGTGPLTDADALHWYAPADGTSNVTVIVSGAIADDAAPATYPNTATVTPDPKGPVDEVPENNTDDADITILPGWTVEKTADPASGSTVSAGDEITYSVTAAALSQGAESGIDDITLTDSLADVAPYADFAAGSVRIDGQEPTAGVAVEEPSEANDYTLTVSGLDLPGGGSAVVTYRVTVRADAAALSELRNSVLGDAEGNPPVQCAAPDEPDYADHCVTVHRTPPLIQVLKVGESSEGGLVAFEGSEWGIYPDANGAPDETSPVAQLGPEPKTPQISTGLFRLSLEPGSYWLREEKALDGFTLLPDAVPFTVAADGIVALADGPSTVLAACPTEPQSQLCSLVPDDDPQLGTIVVLDVPKVDLPEAGGRTGPSLYVWIGGIVIALALGATVVIRMRTHRSRRER